VVALSVQVTRTSLLDAGVALAFGGAGGGPSVVAHAVLEKSE
jgi:hypothetical protein